MMQAMHIVRLILGRGKMRLPEIITAMGVEEMTEKGPREARKSIPRLEQRIR